MSRREVAAARFRRGANAHLAIVPCRRECSCGRYGFALIFLDLRQFVLERARRRWHGSSYHRDAVDNFVRRPVAAASAVLRDDAERRAVRGRQGFGETSRAGIADNH
jgi:hypothetical protein